MSPTNTEALAARLESGWCPIESPTDMEQAAAALRRLSAERAALRAEQAQPMFPKCASGTSEQAAQAVPAGFVLVPVEFIAAGQRIAQDYARTNPKWPMWDNGEAEPKVQDPCGAHAWLERAAMLAAAPTPPAPEAQQAAGQAQDERAAFEAWARTYSTLPITHDAMFPHSYEDMGQAMLWDAWQARAALAQRQPLTDEQTEDAYGWPDADADAARLALELECLLTGRDVPMPVTSRLWESAHEALALHRQRLESGRAAMLAAAKGVME